MTTKGPSKSVLKKRTPNEPTDEQKAKADRDKRNLDLALSHANRIELRKKIELQILANIETLMELPSTPASPQQDARKFTTLIHPFQPSDFASLVEERRINGSCGYTLCSNPPRSETLGPSASWKLKGKGAEDFCSTACVRRALYVKAQLSQVPAWERVGGEQGEVVLPPSDDDGENGDGVMERVRAAREEGKVGVANRRELAAERGEEATSFKPRQVMMDSVVEKARKKGAGAPEFPTVSREAAYGAIEGYEPKFASVERDDEDASDDGDEGVQNAQAVSFSSEVRSKSKGDEADDAFDEEEEAAWRELQAGLHHLNTGHDR